MDSGQSDACGGVSVLRIGVWGGCREGVRKAVGKLSGARTERAGGPMRVDSVRLGNRGGPITGSLSVLGRGTVAEDAMERDLEPAGRAGWNRRQACVERHGRRGWCGRRAWAWKCGLGRGLVGLECGRVDGTGAWPRSVACGLAAEPGCTTAEVGRTVTTQSELCGTGITGGALARAFAWAKAAAWLFVVVVAGAAMVGGLSGCAVTERENYFGARGTVFTAQAGDATPIASRVNGSSRVARAGEIGE